MYFTLPGVEVPQSVEQTHLWRQVCHVDVPRDVQNGEVVQLVDEGGDRPDAVVGHVQHAQAVEHQPRLRAGLCGLLFRHRAGIVGQGDVKADVSERIIS